MLYDFQIQVFLLFIAASVADAAAVKPSIPNDLTTDFHKGNPDFNNDIKNFENLISADV